MKKALSLLLALAFHFPVRRVQGTAKRRAARQTMAVQPQLRPAKAAKRKMVHRSTASHSSV